MKNQKLQAGYFSLLAIGVFWGMQFMLNKIALEVATPELIAAFRVVIAASVVTVCSLFYKFERAENQSRIISSATFWLYILIAFFEVIVPFFAMAWGQQTVSSGYASILVGTVPIYTLTLSVIFLKDRANLFRKVISIMLGFVGLVCLVSPSLGPESGFGLLGALIIMLGAFCFSVASMLIKCIKNVHPVIMTRNILLLGSIPMLYVIYKNYNVLIQFDTSVWVALICLGSFSSAAAYLLYVNLISSVSPVFASFANYFSPLFGLIFGYIFFNESIYFSTLVSVGMLASSIVINSPGEAFKNVMRKLASSIKNIEYNV